MRVELIAITPEAESVIETAAKTCYDSEPNEQTRPAFLKRLISMGHLSVLEHACATFQISNVSRSLTHQLVRHRLASYSQKSQRYVKENNFKYVTPKSIKDRGLTEGYESLMSTINDFYKMFVDQGIAAEDARYILPNACHTEIAMTMNFRELRHFIETRQDKHAQWEIRELANRILNILISKAPSVFEDLAIKEV